MHGGCTTVEIKTGYGLDPKAEMRLLKLASQLGEERRSASFPPCSRCMRCLPTSATVARIM